MFATLLFAAAFASAPQQLRAEIPLSGIGDPLSNGKAFGLAHEPAQDRLYVAICGDLPFAGTSNRAIAVVDPQADAVVGSIPCGAFPEDIAFAYDPLSGAFRYGACTNSADGSVTIWDATLQVVATVALPDPLSYGSCYPFGIAATGTHFWISTLDGSGDVHAISLATRTLDPAASLHLGPGVLGGRPRVAGSELWLPHSVGLPGFAGAEGGLLRAPLAGGVPASWLVARADNFTLYPAGQDLAAAPGGGAWLGGFDLGGRLWLADPAGGLRRAWELDGRGVQGLAADGAGLGAACTLWGDEILLLDLAAEEVLTVINTGALGAGHHQPNDAVFAHGKLFVTCQGSESLLVFDQLPAAGAPPTWLPGLALTGATPAPGDPIAAVLTAGPGEACALLGAPRCDAAPVAGVELRLGPNPRLLATGSGGCARTLTAPAALPGRAWFVQGLIRRQGAWQPTEPRALVLQ